jgi:hypothetical protein
MNVDSFWIVVIMIRAAGSSSCRLSTAVEELERRYEGKGYGDFKREVAEAVVEAVRRKRLIVPVPRSHVVPPWLIKRLAPRVAQVISRNLPRLVRARR